MKLAFTLKEAIKALAKGRNHRGNLKNDRATAHAVMLKTPEGRRWVEFDEDHKAMSKFVKELESAIRERAVAIYTRAVRIFGAADKKHWTGVTIRDYTAVKVNPEVDLVEWAQIHAPLLVSLSVDMKAFEGLVKAGKIPAGIAWVEKEPRAQIAGKLSE